MIKGTKEDGDLLFECSEWKWFHDASTLVEQRKVIRCTVEGKEDSVFYRVYDPILGSSDTPYLCFMHYCSCHDFHQSNEGFPFVRASPHLFSQVYFLIPLSPI